MLWIGKDPVFWIIFIIAWIIQISLHELSHLILGSLLEDREIRAFKPYPHFCKGHFRFGAYYFGPARKKSDKPWEVHRAPFWMGLIWALTFSLITSVDVVDGIVRGSSQEWKYFAPMITCGVGDVLFFYWGYFCGTKDSDGKKYRFLKTS
jgi:hypothetical protein